MPPFFCPPLSSIIFHSPLFWWILGRALSSHYKGGLQIMASDLWQQLELSSELESALWWTVDYRWKKIVDFNAGKIQLDFFDSPNNIGAILVKTDWSIIEEKPSFKFFFLRLLFISINLPYCLAWNTVAMSGLVLLTGVCIYYINYRSR